MTPVPRDPKHKRWLLENDLLILESLPHLAEEFPPFPARPRDITNFDQGWSIQ